MTKLIVGVSVATVFGMAIVVAAPRETETSKNEQTVTISGCVRAGTEPDTFMLMDVAEVKRQGRNQPVPTDARGRDVLYWLSTTKGLKMETGRRVEVTGTVDLNKVDEGETKVSEDSSKRLDAKTEIKADGKKVTVETDTQPHVAPIATSGAEKSTTKETKRIVYRLKVKSMRSVRGICG